MKRQKLSQKKIPSSLQFLRSLSAFHNEKKKSRFFIEENSVAASWPKHYFSSFVHFLRAKASSWDQNDEKKKSGKWTDNENKKMESNEATEGQQKLEN